MAQALKAGETVTVAKDIRFEPNTPEYKNGLRSIKTGDVGTVVDAATGRSVVVEFGGKRATLGSQRLERVAAPVKSPATAPVNAPVAASQKPPVLAAPSARKPAQKPRSAEKAPAPKPDKVPTANVSTVDEGNTELVATLANSVLLSGGLKSAQDTVLQIRLSELPRKLQARITDLVQAKLELGTKKSSSPTNDSDAATPRTGTRQRGRKSQK